MAATSDEEMESLLSAFDQIYEDAKSGISEMQLLQSNYNAELKMRESLQVASNALKSEKDRLAKLYSESLKNLADQLDYRTNCLILKEELERAKTEVSLKEDGYRKDTGLLKREYEQQISCLEAQVKESLHEKATYEATISQLHGDLAAHKSHMQVIAMRLDQLHVEVESKYNSEIQDLKECLAVEQEEKNELNRKIQNLEKELLICKAKLVDQQQEMTANWHVETLKQKIMKLRKENEVLKRKLSHSEEGK
ncbi:protein At-4/1 isoform X1 [Vigna umbellata]|uniref:protein At-4/1 isoform X1 n=1 Tax=Vigna umbellata TaxID=87088 RepID=UPI001F5E9C81|nr:protein At-4/1 isoform X1 [Vigna umbellata]